MPASDKVNEGVDIAVETAETMIPKNLSEAEGLASMLAINMAADHLIERTLGKKLTEKVAQQAVKGATKSAAQSVSRAIVKQAATKAAVKMTTQAAVAASSGPYGWMMLAVQVGGMLLDFFDPFNIARSYTNHDLQSMHDMMAGALTATLKGAKACIDPSFTGVQSATDTQPEVMCTDDDICIAMYPGQSKLKPPSTAQCFDLPFPATAKPQMPKFDPRLPRVILDLLAIPEAQGALLLHNWLTNEPDARAFADPVVDRTYRAFFEQAMIAEWQAAGNPTVPASDVKAPQNIDGSSIAHTPVMQRAANERMNNGGDSDENKDGKSNTKAISPSLVGIGILGVIAAVGLTVWFVKRYRANRAVKLAALRPQAVYQQPQVVYQQPQAVYQQPPMQPMRNVPMQNVPSYQVPYQTR